MEDIKDPGPNLEIKNATFEKKSTLHGINSR